MFGDADRAEASGAAGGEVDVLVVHGIFFDACYEAELVGMYGEEVGVNWTCGIPSWRIWAMEKARRAVVVVVVVVGIIRAVVGRTQRRRRKGRRRCVVAIVYSDCKVYGVVVIVRKNQGRDDY